MEKKSIHEEFDTTDIDAEMAAQAEAAKKPAKFPDGTGDVPLLDSDLLEEDEEEVEESDIVSVEDDK